MFEVSNRRIRFLLPLPNRSDPKFWETPGRKLQRGADTAFKEWEQACHQASSAERADESIGSFRWHLWIHSYHMDIDPQGFPQIPLRKNSPITPLPVIVWRHQ
jgi:hypothetical protein